MIYVYMIDGKKIGVAAASSTIAQFGIQQKYPGQTSRYVGTMDDFFQVNGTADLEGECKVIDEPKEPNETTTTDVQ